MSKKGERVIAIASQEDGVIYSFGSGVYTCDEIPPEGIIGPFGQVITPNPKIELDTGEVVWGCECWWGPEEMVKERYLKEGVKVVLITPLQYRKQSYKEGVS